MSELGLEPIMLADLIEEIDEDMVPIVFESFLEDTAENLEAIEKAISDAKGDQLRKQAHKLKGCLISVRAQNASLLAKKLESYGDSSEFAAAGSLIAELRAEYDKVIEFIKSYLAKQA
ncbi:MAG: Hpt domain-containing protein [Candidatus Obscuribacterales bacterium]|nr:Hpt domain-containing protein [Candidatus Obscuribacterales bacterium]